MRIFGCSCAGMISLRASSDRALMIVVGCNLFEWGTFLRRIDNFLSDLVLIKPTLSDCSMR